MRTCSVAYSRALTRIPFAVSENAKVVALKRGQRNALDDGGGEGAEQQQDECDEEDDG